MPRTHPPIPSPLSPHSSSSESLGPLSEYHQPQLATTDPHQTLTQPQRQNPADRAPPIFPLAAERPDSPTLGHLSPVSIISPNFHPSHDPLHSHRTTTVGESRFLTPRTAAPAPPVDKIEMQAESGVPHLARGATLRLQDHAPFARVGTRFPPRTKATTNETQARPLADVAEAEAEADTNMENVSARPLTSYLADHSPHQLANPPTQPIQRPTYDDRPGINSRRAEEGVFQEIELCESRQNDASHPPSEADRNARDVEGGWKTKAEIKRRKRNCLIGWGFAVALVVAGAVLAVLAVEAHRPGGVAYGSGGI